MLACCSGTARCSATSSGRRRPHQQQQCSQAHSTADLCRCTAQLHPRQHLSLRRRARWNGPAALPTGGEDSSSGGVDWDAAFAKELAARQAAEATAAEASASQTFDGEALLSLVRRMPRGEGRSYDLSLVKRPYLGKVFVALNVMWRYKEQKSFGYSEEEFKQRMEYIASALRAWGVVATVTNALTSTKERPRVGKAVSIMLDVPLERVNEWLS